MQPHTYKFDLALLFPRKKTVICTGGVDLSNILSRSSSEYYLYTETIKLGREFVEKLKVDSLISTFSLSNANINTF